VEEFGATCEDDDDDDEGWGSSWLIVEAGVERRSFSTVDGSRTTVFLVGPGGLGESLDFLALPFHGRLFGCGPHPEVEVDDGLFSDFCFFFPSDFVMVKIG
jgi:hypothetical protein